MEYTLERVTRRTAEMQFVFGAWREGGNEVTVGWRVCRDGRPFTQTYRLKRDARARQDREVRTERGMTDLVAHCARRSA